LVVSHCITITPPLPAGFFSTVIVNCSTGAESVSTRIGTRPRSSDWVYSVPHCPVFLFSTSVQVLSVRSE
jgi:hypothetical protein